MGKYRFITDINRAAWGIVLNNTVIHKVAQLSHVSEAMVGVVFLSLFFTFLMAAVRCAANPPILPYFGVPEIAFLASVHWVSVQLPVVHTRLKTALNTYVSVIRSYPDYKDAYIRQTRDASMSSGSLARYIYNTDGGNDFLFSKAYDTIHSIRGCVDAKPGVWAPVLATAILLAGILLAAGSENKRKVFALLALRGTVLCLCAASGCGVFVACLVIWGFGAGVSGLLMSLRDVPEKEGLAVPD